ncbi:hypothetical protein C8J56DRAFT_891963 [Mycena floridula]|nr:hypothetical protein C8J56DRAFT_891963 [Mycena floridula]
MTAIPEDHQKLSFNRLILFSNPTSTAVFNLKDHTVPVIVAYMMDHIILMLLIEPARPSLIFHLPSIWADLSSSSALLIHKPCLSLNQRPLHSICWAYMFVTKSGPLYDIKTWEVLLGVPTSLRHAWCDRSNLSPYLFSCILHTIKQLDQIATVSSSSRTLDEERFYAIRDATVILSGMIQDADASCFQTYPFRCAIMQSHLDFELQLQNILAIAINQSDGTDWLCNLSRQIDRAVGVVTILRIDSLLYVPDLLKNVEATCELTTGIMQFGLPADEHCNLVLQWFNIPYSTLYLKQSLFLQTLKSAFGPHLSVALMLPLVWDTHRDPVKYMTHSEVQVLAHGSLVRFLSTLDTVVAEYGTQLFASLQPEQVNYLVWLLLSVAAAG